MIDVPVKLQRQVSKCPSRQEKPWKFIKLQFIDKVVDISVNMWKSGTQVQHNDKFIGRMLRQRVGAVQWVR